MTHYRRIIVASGNSLALRRFVPPTSNRKGIIESLDNVVKEYQNVVAYAAYSFARMKCKFVVWYLRLREAEMVENNSSGSHKGLRHANIAMAALELHFLAQLLAQRNLV